MAYLMNYYTQIQSPLFIIFVRNLLYGKTNLFLLSFVFFLFAKLVAPSVLFLESQNGAISIGRIHGIGISFFFNYSDQESSWTLL